MARDAMEARQSDHQRQPCGGMSSFVCAIPGPGIPRNNPRYLVEPFVTCGKAMGTGLGLAIAKKTAEDHGGAIAVESVPEQGATFIVRLPLKPKNAETSCLFSRPGV